jgi:TPR repeat protein
MLEKTRRFSSDSDLDTYKYDADGPRFGRYPYRKAGVAQVPDEPVPLFLSDDDESEPQPYEFVRERPRRKTFTVARILVGSFAVIAAAGIAAMFSSDATRAIIVNAKASLAATLNQPNGPSREEISAALKTARQIEADVRQPAPVVASPVVAPAVVAPAVVAPPPAPAPRVEKIDPDTLAGMMSRAKSLMAIGDISSARLLLERAAEAQEADAAFMLGQTYDPAVLGSQDIRSISADPAKARNWYQKAAQLGSADAQQRLAQMQN